MKKNFLLFAACSLLMLTASAQNVAINTDGSKPNANAILDIKSANKGILIPRITTDARNRLGGTKGLLVYDITTDNFWYHTGREWKCIPNDDDKGKNGNAWLITGNNNTKDKVNFLGTTNNVPLNIRVNNQPSGRIDSAKSNTFWGYRAGADSGTNNTAVGNSALRANTGASWVTAIGSLALSSNTTGNFNTACGAVALQLNTAGDYNTAIGFQAMLLNSTGFRNEACGAQALLSNTSGGGNAANGFEALIANTTGGGNTATGSDALETNTTGSTNTATGTEALARSTTSNDNTATGAVCLGSNTTGHDNTAEGVATLSNNVTGSNNTAIGSFTMLTNIAGSNNTVVGQAADVASDGLTNATAIGSGAIVDASNKVRIGNGAVTVIEGQVPFTTPSDGRYKFNVAEDVKGLDFILQLRPVTYQFDVKRFDGQLNRQGDDAGGKAGGSSGGSTNYAMQVAYDEATRIRRSGFIAQEVEQAAQSTGYDFSGIIRPRTAQDHYSLSYEAFVVPLVKAVQEQQVVIRSQSRQLDGQSVQIARLQKELDEIKALLSAPSSSHN